MEYSSESLCFHPSCNIDQIKVKVIVKSIKNLATYAMLSFSRSPSNLIGIGHGRSFSLVTAIQTVRSYY